MSDDDKKTPEENKVTVIKADRSLKNEIGNLMSLDKILSERVVKLAEQKIEDNVDYLKDAYDTLLEHYAFYLRGAFEELKYAESWDEQKQCMEDIQHTALAIKSSASIFKYDLAEKFSTSLYLTIPKIKKIDDKVYLLLESYIKGIEIIACDKITGVEDQIAKQLLAELERIAESQSFL